MHFDMVLQCFVFLWIAVLETTAQPFPQNVLQSQAVANTFPQNALAIQQVLSHYGEGNIPQSPQGYAFIENSVQPVGNPYLNSIQNPQGDSLTMLNCPSIQCGGACLARLGVLGCPVCVCDPDCPVLSCMADCQIDYQPLTGYCPYCLCFDDDYDSSDDESASQEETTAPTSSTTTTKTPTTTESTSSTTSTIPSTESTSTSTKGTTTTTVSNSPTTTTLTTTASTTTTTTTTPATTTTTTLDTTTTTTEPTTLTTTTTLLPTTKLTTIATTKPIPTTTTTTRNAPSASESTSTLDSAIVTQPNYAALFYPHIPETIPRMSQQTSQNENSNQQVEKLLTSNEKNLQQNFLFGARTVTNMYAQNLPENMYQQLSYPKPPLLSAPLIMMNDLQNPAGLGLASNNIQTQDNKNGVYRIPPNQQAFATNNIQNQVNRDYLLPSNQQSLATNTIQNRASRENAFPSNQPSLVTNSIQNKVIRENIPLSSQVLPEQFPTKYLQQTLDPQSYQASRYPSPSLPGFKLPNPVANYPLPLVHEIIRPPENMANYPAAPMPEYMPGGPVPRYAQAQMQEIMHPPEPVPTYPVQPQYVRQPDARPGYWAAKSADLQSQEMSARYIAQLPELHVMEPINRYPAPGPYVVYPIAQPLGSSPTPSNVFRGYLEPLPPMMEAHNINEPHTSKPQDIAQRYAEPYQPLERNAVPIYSSRQEERTGKNSEPVKKSVNMFGYEQQTSTKSTTSTTVTTTTTEPTIATTKPTSTTETTKTRITDCMFIKKSPFHVFRCWNVVTAEPRTTDRHYRVPRQDLFSQQPFVNPNEDQADMYDLKPWSIGQDYEGASTSRRPPILRQRPVRYCRPVQCSGLCSSVAGTDGCPVCNCDPICPQIFCEPGCLIDASGVSSLCPICSCDDGPECPNVDCGSCQTTRNADGCNTCMCDPMCPLIACPGDCQLEYTPNTGACAGCECMGCVCRETDMIAERLKMMPIGDYGPAEIILDEQRRIADLREGYRTGLNMRPIAEENRGLPRNIYNSPGRDDNRLQVIQGVNGDDSTNIGRGENRLQVLRSVNGDEPKNFGSKQKRIPNINGPKRKEYYEEEENPKLSPRRGPNRSGNHVESGVKKKAMELLRSPKAKDFIDKILENIKEDSESQDGSYGPKILIEAERGEEENEERPKPDHRQKLPQSETAHRTQRRIPARHSPRAVQTRKTSKETIHRGKPRAAPQHERRKEALRKEKTRAVFHHQQTRDIERNERIKDAIPEKYHDRPREPPYRKQRKSNRKAKIGRIGPSVERRKPRMYKDVSDEENYDFYDD